MPDVSVIIPTYNRSNLIGEAIQSVLNQKFSDFELIIIDDGSTDNTERVVHSFSDPRLKFIKQLNRGPSAARNTGIAASGAKFVAFLDSDDLFLPEKLDLQLAKFQEIKEADLVYGKYYTYKMINAPSKLSGVCYSSLDLSRLLMGPAFHWSTVLIRRSCLEKAGGFDENFPVGEEWELTLRLALAGCVMVCLPLPLSRVRIQPDSLSRGVHDYAASGDEILDKIFNDPRMPPQLFNQRSLAHASLLIRRAGSAYLAKNPELGKKILSQAIEIIDPMFSLDGSEINLIIRRFVNYVMGLSTDDSERILRRVMKHLPGGNLNSGKLKRLIWSEFCLEAAFAAYSRGQLGQSRNYAVRAISVSPSNLGNRGLISIFFRSLIGNRLNV